MGNATIDDTGKITRAAIYIRVSTQEQAQEGYSIGAQKERLQAYCIAKDWTVSGIFADPGFSGTNLDRPGIQELISRISEFDVCIVWKLDRLSRSQRDTIYLIEDVFLPNKVDFVSTCESFDTSTPFGRAMVGILSVFAQLEREQILDRTWMGHIERAKEGRFYGGYAGPIGYDIGPDGHLVVNDYEAIQVRRIYELYNSGLSQEAIVRKMHEEGYVCRNDSWDNRLAGISRVNRMLTSDIYLGRITLGEVVTENAHEAIITQKTFDKAMALRAKRREQYGGAAFQSKYLLSGLLYCKRCGAKYGVKNQGRDYKYYTCYSRSKTKRSMMKAAGCDNKIWPVGELDMKIELELTKVLYKSGYARELMEMHEAAMKKEKGRDIDAAKAVEKEIESIKRRIGRMMDLYQDDKIPAELLAERINEMHEKKNRLEQQMSEMGVPKAVGENEKKEVEGFIGDLGAVWKSASDEERRDIAASLIDRVDLDGENFDIKWGFLEGLK